MLSYVNSAELTPVCASAANTVTFRFGYQGGKTKPGTVLLCRDHSQALPPPGCAGYSAPPPGPDYWVSCDKVTACNSAPNSFSGQYVTVGSDSDIQYDVSWRNLPINCHVLIDVIAVDGAANVSPGFPLKFDQSIGI
jgi:hypothetical protein